MHETSMRMAAVRPQVGKRAELERWMSIAAAAALVSYGLSRRSIAGTCVAAAAVPLAFRGLFGEWPLLVNGPDGSDTRVALSGEGGIHVLESIRLEKPIGEVYRFWRQFSNLPRFMHYLDRVAELGDGRSHWVAKGPADVPIEWNAEIINEVENKVIGWRSLPNSDIVMAGSVTFASVRGGSSTQLSVHFQYAAPADAVGAAVARLVGREPSQTVREDLRRLKQLLEAGEIATAETTR
jgi:uncharacterized membrane protein